MEFSTCEGEGYPHYMLCPVGYVLSRVSYKSVAFSNGKNGIEFFKINQHLKKRSLYLDRYGPLSMPSIG